MAGEIGGPPGLPEFSAKKEDDSSEKKKSRFSFLRAQEDAPEAPPTPPPAELFAAQMEKDDDEEEEGSANWFKAFGKKFKDSVAMEDEATPEDKAPAPETETPVAEQSQDASVDAEPIEDMPALPEIPAVDQEYLEEPTEVEVPAEEAPVEVIDEVVDEEPTEPTETPEVTPVAETAAETEPEDADEEETPATSTTRRGSRSSGGLSGISGFAAGAAIPAAEAAKSTPNTTTGSSNALPLVGLGVAAYAHHKAAKARREVGEERSQREAQIKSLAAEQAKQQQELQRRLNQLNVAPVVPAMPRLEQESPTLPEQQNQPVEKSAETDEKVSPDLQEKTVDQQPELPVAELEQINPRTPDQIRTDLGVEKTPAPELAPSVGDIIAEKAGLKNEVEQRTSKETEKIVAEEYEQSNVPNAAELLEVKHRDKAAELFLQQVEAAAEQGVAIENQYERQHEVKDVSSVSYTSGVVGASSPIVTDDLFQKDSPDVSQYIRANYDGSSTTYQSPVKKTVQQYRYAMVRGVVGAGAIIIGAIVWAVL